MCHNLYCIKYSEFIHNNHRFLVIYLESKRIRSHVTEEDTNVKLDRENETPHSPYLFNHTTSIDSFHPAESAPLQQPLAYLYFLRQCTLYNRQQSQLLHLYQIRTP